MENLGTITRGDTEVIPLVILNGDDSARNITNDSLKFTLKKKKSDPLPLVQKTVGSGIIKTNTAQGIIEVTLGTSDLLLLDREQRFPAELEVTDNTGKVATTHFTLDFLLDLA